MTHALLTPHLLIASSALLIVQKGAIVRPALTSGYPFFTALDIECERIFYFGWALACVQARASLSFAPLSLRLFQVPRPHRIQLKRPLSAAPMAIHKQLNWLLAAQKRTRSIKSQSSFDWSRAEQWISAVIKSQSGRWHYEWMNEPLCALHPASASSLNALTRARTQSEWVFLCFKFPSSRAAHMQAIKIFSPQCHHLKL